jgi:SecD/SecF fusion protein
MSQHLGRRAFVVLLVIGGAVAVVLTCPPRPGREIDGVFVAALLTVVGYSINDSVVVFDRIREQLASRVKEPLAAAASDACLETIPRTVTTGLGALFILVALYVLGGARPVPARSGHGDGLAGPGGSELREPGSRVRR